MDRRYTKRVETWTVDGRRIAKIVVRDQNGTFHGSTNFAQRSKVGQVASARR